MQEVESVVKPVSKHVLQLMSHSSQTLGLEPFVVYPDLHESVQVETPDIGTDIR